MDPIRRIFSQPICQVCFLSLLLVTDVSCVESSLIYLLNWDIDIPSHLDLTETERYCLRDYLISLLHVSLEIVHHCITKFPSQFESAQTNVIQVDFFRHRNLIWSKGPLSQYAGICFLASKWGEEVPIFSISLFLGAHSISNKARNSINHRSSDSW